MQEKPADNSLSAKVQMQFMRPAQLEAALRKFPVVYVPFGLIEWHGRHLPLGNDALKAHAFLVKCAGQFIPLRDPYRLSRLMMLRICLKHPPSGLDRHFHPPDGLDTCVPPLLKRL